MSERRSGAFGRYSKINYQNLLNMPENVSAMSTLVQYFERQLPMPGPLCFRHPIYFKKFKHARTTHGKFRHCAESCSIYKNIQTYTVCKCGWWVRPMEMNVMFTLMTIYFSNLMQLNFHYSLFCHKP